MHATDIQPPAGAGGSVLLPCQAILFDCDGVLVDSDDSVQRAWTRWAQTFGFDPEPVVSSVHGRRAADTVDALIEPAGRAEALATINDYELEDAVGVHNISGAAELVSSLPDGSWAVVTSGTVALATARLRAAGIPVPKVFVTADRVAAGKPAPDGYLAAAQALGVQPEEAVVLEDSASGVESGRRAGVGWVVGVGKRALDTDADVVVADLRALAWTPEGLRAGPDGLLRTAPHENPAP